MPEIVNLPRRGFMGVVAATLAAAQFGGAQTARAQTSQSKATPLP